MAVSLMELPSAAFKSANTVLGLGVIGQETDTGKVKIGNGSTAWNSLGYYADDNRFLQLVGVSATAAAIQAAAGAGGTQLLGSAGVTLAGGGTIAAPTITVGNIQSVDLTLANGETAGDIAGAASGDSASFTQTPASGQLLLRFFRARNSWTAMKHLWFITKGTAPASLTLVKGGLFSWDGTTLTLLDSTADLHSTFTGSFAGHQVALAAGTANITQGSYYAIGLLQVGTTPGSLAGTDGFTAFQMGLGQNIHGLATPAATLASQSDMPASIAGSALSTSVTPYMMACSVVNT